MEAREIKFRGKPLLGGNEWVYGDLFMGKYILVTDNQTDVQYTPAVPSSHFGSRTDCKVTITKPTYQFIDLIFEVKPETIGQFIWMIDKNGKEIYTDDIVLFYTQYYYHLEERKGLSKREGYNGEGRKEVVGIAYGLLTPFYDPGYTEDEQGDWFQDKYGFEVIGNIHDNPTLLQQ